MPSNCSSIKIQILYWNSRSYPPQDLNLAMHIPPWGCAPLSLTSL